MPLTDDITVTYAENKEDLLLAAFFPDITEGFYIDIGAGHPVVSNVTKHFYDLGWHGINIEPNRKYFNLLKKDRPRDINLNIGVSNKNSKLKLREYKGWGYSTFSDKMKEVYLKEPISNLTDSYKDYTVAVKTLKDILDENNIGHIDFMKVDIEGFEYEALVGNDWAKYRPSIICIESNHIIKDWTAILRSNGYKKVFYDGLNDYYVAKEAAERASYFNYPEAVLSSPIIPLRWHQEIGALNRRIQLIEQSNEAVTHELQQHIRYLEDTIISNNRIRHQIFSLGQNINNAIIIQIEKLNKPRIKRNKHHYGNKTQIPDTDDDRVLLSAARLSDLNGFYSQHGHISVRRNYVYKTVKATHYYVSGLIRFTVKRSYRLMKKAYSFRKG